MYRCRLLRGSLCWSRSPGGVGALREVAARPGAHGEVAGGRHNRPPPEEPVGLPGACLLHPGRDAGHCVVAWRRVRPWPAGRRGHAPLHCGPGPQHGVRPMCPALPASGASARRGAPLEPLGSGRLVKREDLVCFSGSTGSSGLVFWEHWPACRHDICFLLSCFACAFSVSRC